MKRDAAWLRRLLTGFLTVVLACSIGAPGLRAYAEESAPDGEGFPAAYDLRDVDGHCYVTPVKFQNPFGTCWGFAAIAAAETSVLGSHFEDDPLAYKSLDFSEKQLCYFSQYHLDDPANSQNTEGVYSLKYDMGEDGSFYLKEPETAEDHYTGGTLFLATSMFASGAGPTLESKSDALVYKGKEGKTINFEDGTPYCYSYDDDWTLDAEYRFMQDYVLKESYMLPSPAAFWSNPETSEGGYLYDEEGTKAIKDQLMQKRGVSISFHADTSLPWDTGYGLYMDTTTWAHYTYDDSLPNHGVTIIGWDDNYPASNFTHDVYQRADPNKGYEPSNFKTDENGNYVLDEETTALTTPPADGAWLVKNSWGSGEEDFPNNGGGDWGIPVQKTDDFGNPVFDENGNPVMVGSGYFWLSYYDWSLDRPEAFVFDTELTAPGSIYDQETLHCNQFDLMPATSMQANENDDLIKSANVFTTEAGEHVMCASYITSTPNTTVTVEVYLLHDGFASPEDGVLVAQNTEVRELAGFYIDYLGGKPVDVQPGQSYSVVVTQKQDTGKYAVDYPTGFGPFNALIDEGMVQNFTIAVQNNESFVYYDGAWSSWADEEARDVFLGNNEETGLGEGFTQKIFELVLNTQYDNFPIKSYAFDYREDLFVRLAGAEKLSVCVGADSTAFLELYGDDSEGLSIDDYANDAIIKIIDWGLESGTERLIELVPSEDGTHAQVKGLAEGTGYIAANVRGVGSVVIPVQVHAHNWGAPTYVWSDDNSTVTASRVCSYDASHVEIETVATTSQTTKEPTTTEQGSATLTATFANPAFETQSKTVAIPKLQPSGSSGGNGSSGQSKQQSTGSKTTLAKTGDSTPYAAICVLLFAGIVAVVAGIVMSRRRDSKR